ncbi:hypothetical protein EV714DRAFT_277749 [Schizophyllum commune]
MSRFLTVYPLLSALPETDLRTTLIHERGGAEEESALVMDPPEALQAPRLHLPNSRVKLVDPSPPTCPRAQILNGHTSPLCELSMSLFIYDNYMPGYPIHQVLSQYEPSLALVMSVFWRLSKTWGDADCGFGSGSAHKMPLAA